MSDRRRLLLTLLNQGVWLPYSFEYIYHDLIPTTIDNKQVKNKLKLATIYGNSVVENQLVEDDFGSSTSYWAKNRLTQSNSNNIATFTTNSNSYAFVSAYHSFSAGQLVKGHYYMYSLYFRITSGSCSRMEIDHHGTRVAYVDNPTLNQWYRLVGIVQQTRENTETTNGFDITRRYTSTSDVVVNSDTFEAKEPMLIDLTQKHPFDTPTTLTDNRVQAILNRGYIAFNSGEIKNTDIGEFSSEPYNLFDEELEQGGTSQGADFSSMSNVRSKNYMKVVGGRSYTFCESATSNKWKNRYVVQYDTNKNWIKDVGFGNSVGGYGIAYSGTLEPNCSYIKIKYYAEQTITPSDFSKVYFTQTGTRTGYAPHTSPQTLPFKYQGGGVGTSHDTMEIGKENVVFTKNIGRVDYNGNANENWQEYGSGSQRFTILNNLWSSPSSSIVANILCDRLQPCAKNEIFNKEYAISGSDDNVNYFVVRINSSINDVSSLKSWLSNNPISVEYQLATPQVITIPRKHLGIKRISECSWGYDNTCFYTRSITNHKVIDDVGIVANIYCCAFITVNQRANNQGSANLSISSASDLFKIRDTSISNTTDFLNKYGDYLIFYETQDEVADIIDTLGIEAGGTFTSDSEVLPNVDTKIKGK